jgi:hypothetical protein
MHAIATTILALATMSGEEAADRDYDALTPETARALLRCGTDIVPDYAREAVRGICEGATGLPASDFRDTRIETLATETWARAYRAAWPASGVVDLAAQVDAR